MRFWRLLLSPAYGLELRRLRIENQRLREQLEAERSRHLLREEALLDRVLVSKGQAALPITKPEAPRVPQEPTLTGLQRAERDAWGQFAVDAGKPRHEGHRDWDQAHGRLNGTH